MRNWGIVITAFYAVIVLVLISYGWMWLAGPHLAESFDDGFFEDIFLELLWIPFLIILLAQMLLLFLSVDTSWRRLRPRQHVHVTAGLAGFLLMVLVFAMVFAFYAAVYGDENGPVLDWLERSPLLSGVTLILGLIFLLWAFWGLLFLKYAGRTSNMVDSAVKWLIAGSVLELLVAVPCHIIVRQREDCSAPAATAYGIATGIAIMLMAFGPGVLYLYKRRLGDYRDK